MAETTAERACFPQLNPSQRAAVEHGDAPLLVLAGPGSGKTATLAARAARLLADGADPQRLLMLTFSRRAAREMAHRVSLLARQALGLHAAAPAPALPWAGTFHAVAARLLRELAPGLGLSSDFTILDRVDAGDLLALQRQALGLASQRQRFPLKGTCLAIYSCCVNTARPLPEVLAARFPWCADWPQELNALFAAYTRAKHAQAVLDYDDLLACWAEALAEPAVGQALSARFRHVLVDEYQDTNRLQAQIVQRLRPDGRGLTAVGDDAQAIYGFRGADVGHILQFPAQFADARVLTLAQSYRSTQPLLDASNAVMAAAWRRHPKSMWSAVPGAARPQIVTVADEAAQAAWVADEVLRQREGGLELRQQAVLFRTARHSAALELELTRRRIPFVKYGGLQFIETSHVKDLMSLLRWSQNPRHATAGYRCLLLVPGIGTGLARRALDALQAEQNAPGVLRQLPVRPAAAADWAAFCDLFEQLQGNAQAGPQPLRWPESVDAVLAWYRPQLERLHADAPVRWADLLQLQHIARGYPSRERFLAELTLDPPQASSDEPGEPQRDEDYLILSTIHSAKGQEWSAVHVLNVVDGCLPADLATGSAEEIDEERRLLYVAMTRARRQLHLLVPQRFHVGAQMRRGDRHLYAVRSRFLTNEVAAACDAVAPAVEDTEGAATPSGGASVDLAARMQARWS
jgi:DNA helicase-2/ATP-dependent DNA helicase PcrA